MLSELIIENFKSHKKTKLKFAEGLTLLVGKSQSGKSAALEAFCMLMENRPSGTRFMYRRKKKGTVKVTAVFDEEVEVTIEKKISGKSADTIYTIHNDAGEEQKFRKVARTVPEEVLNVINIGSSNIQKQTDDSYLVESSKGEISREVGNFIGINAIQTAIKKVVTEMNEVKNEIKREKDSLEDAQEQIDKFKDLEKAKRNYIVYQRASEEIKELREEVEKLVDFVKTTPRLEKKLKRYEGILEKISKYKVELAELINDEVTYKESIKEIDLYLKISREYSTTKLKLKEVREKLMALRICPFCSSNLTEKQVEKLLEREDS